MVGRKRKFGAPRDAKGRIKRSHQIKEKQLGVSDVVLDQRRRHCGAVAATDARNGHGRSHANDRRYGYALGRLLISGAISDRQHNAGQDFAELFSAYSRVADMPSPVIPAIDYAGISSGRYRELEADEAASIKRRYLSACRAVNKAGVGAFSSLYDVVIRDVDPSDCPRAKAALEEIVKHFTRRRKTPRSEKALS